MAVVLTNNAVSRLASSLTAGATTLSVTTGEGAKFPSPSAGQWFPVTLVKSSGALEIVRCTSRAGDVMTVVRGQESTAAQSFAAGDRVELRLTAAAFASIQTLIDEALRKDDNLASLEDDAEARDNLGLKTGAITDKQTAVTDATAGRLLIVGAHGVGAGVAASGVASLNSAVVGSVIEVNGVNSDATANVWPSLTTLDGADANTPVRYEVTTSGSDLYTIQRAVFMLATPARVKGRGFIRLRINGTWQPWGADVIEGTYGIGRTPLLLTSSDNLNSVTVFGHYSWASGSLPVNYPFSSSGYLDVSEVAGADIIQIATDRSTSQKWKRTSATGSSWSAWIMTGGKRECTAWVNCGPSFTIRDSYNVSSVSDLGTGRYGINFLTAMDNTGYSVSMSARRLSTNDVIFSAPYGVATGSAFTTTRFNMITFRSDLAVEAPETICANFFGGKS